MADKATQAIACVASLAARNNRLAQVSLVQRPCESCQYPKRYIKKQK